MAKKTVVSDLVLVLNGILKVVRRGAVIQGAKVETVVRNSSVKKAIDTCPDAFKNMTPKKDLGSVIERASMVPVGVVQFATVASKHLANPFNRSGIGTHHQHQYEDNSGPGGGVQGYHPDIRDEDLDTLFTRSLGVEGLQRNEDWEKYSDEKDTTGHEDQVDNHEETPADDTLKQSPQSKVKKQRPVPHATPSEAHSQQTSQLLDSSLFESLAAVTSTTPQHAKGTEDGPPKKESKIKPKPNVVIKPLSERKPLSQLGETSKQRKVPATRISRLVSYGGLAAGLGFGALAEVTKRTLGVGLQDDKSALLSSSPFLTEANATRIVDTLCRVRGAALKIGQILSIQDNSLINPQLQKAFERVRHSADFMPNWQMERMLVSELGEEWKSKLAEFDSKPFAAASIGQVHLGKLHDGRRVAIKIQYPGVAQGINSDIDNLMTVLNVWSIIPEGIFIDNIITVAKRELAWEVDYIREAQCAKRFRKLMEPYTDYYVPDVIDEISTKQVYTTELIEGIPIDQCQTLDQETRDHICFLMLDLFFREIFEFQFMQTDPNWANFLYNKETKQIGLLDFGSAREYKKSFVDKYMRIFEGAADGDKEAILKFSREIGFLSGYESKTMEVAHIDSVLLLGEALRVGDDEGGYDFGSQDLTRRIQRLVPVMVKERLVPPPEEIYSLHRKLSGVFLLCSKLRGRVKCRDIFDRVKRTYKFDTTNTDNDDDVISAYNK